MFPTLRTLRTLSWTLALVLGTAATADTVADQLRAKEIARLERKLVSLDKQKGKATAQLDCLKTNKCAGVELGPTTASR